MNLVGPDELPATVEFVIVERAEEDDREAFIRCTAPPAVFLAALARLTMPMEALYAASGRNQAAPQ